MLGRRKLLIAGLGTVAAMSGCVGGGSGDGSTSDDTAFDGDAVAGTHREGLVGAGSFTVEWSQGFETAEEPDREPLVYERLIQFDLVGDRAFEHKTDSFGSSEYFAYAEGEDVYLREAGGFTKDFSNRRLRRAELGGTMLRLDSAIADSWLEFVGERARFSDLGSETLDGVSITRYEATVDGIDLGQLTDAHYTILVDEAGIARIIDLYSETESRDGTHQQKTERWHFTDIGSTSVVEPSFVAELR